MPIGALHIAERMTQESMALRQRSDGRAGLPCRACALAVEDAVRVPGRAVRKRLRRLAKALGRTESAVTVCR